MSADVAGGERVEILYERAYEDFAADVFRFLLAWTNDWSSAEDLTQEAYLRLWRHRTSVDWQRPILPWLVVTSKRLANNRFRDLRRALRISRMANGPDEDFRARWLDVREAMAVLTTLERAALVLTAIEGWSYVEAAGVLGTTDGALRSAVSRARTKLEAA